ncbi:MAG: DUF1624 domain-containing protein [Chitinophagaceae bacterium]|nr:DUF1624 domain-containing protein [Chitinophagaceae bacterium]
MRAAALAIPTALKSNRIQSIDLLRGLVMIIMALDHTRDFFHAGAFTSDPLDPVTTTPQLYFTRWVTHFCAPSFVFLAGVSAWLQGTRKSKNELSRFLISRGLWLILLEVTVVTFGITGDIYFNYFILQTIWSIGISMFFLGFVIRLPYPVILSIGLVIVFGHNLLDYPERLAQGAVPLWWNFLHLPNVIPLGGGRSLGIFYPFLPWTGLMILGYCFGKIFTHYNSEQRNKVLLLLGICAMMLFLVLRFINAYGDPASWNTQQRMVRTFFSFMNVQKYPPSLMFMCATVGSAILFLYFFRNATGRWADMIKVYGRVPFFFYILHFYLLNFLSVADYLRRGHSLAEGMEGVPGLPFKFAVPGEGHNLGVVYLVWIGVVVLLYPLCKWYDAYKLRHKEKWWLSYL